MTFEDWMRYQGLSESSVKKYEGAIRGSLSAWAMEAGITDGPLTATTSASQFESIAIALRRLPTYQNRNTRGHSMYNSALVQYAKYLETGFDDNIEEDIESILADNETTETDKATLLKTRIGQGGFRQRLIALWGACAVTGYKDTSMLVASHIKPWSVSTNSERLDRYNGILLLPTLDKAFDSGFISFDDQGKIMISPLLEEPRLLGISEKMAINLLQPHHKYLLFHREQVFRDK